MCRLYDPPHSFCTSVAESGAAESDAEGVPAHAGWAREGAIAALETRDCRKRHGKESHQS